MANCSVCGGRLGFFDTKGVCSKRDCLKSYRAYQSQTKAEVSEVRAKEKKSLAAKEKLIANLEREKSMVRELRIENAVEAVLLTTETAPELKVINRLEIVTAECAFGMNIFKDLFAGVRDVVGGRSAAVQSTMRDSRRVALSELKREAYEIGANAVIGVDLDYMELSSGASMVLLVASGTAVVIEDNQSYSEHGQVALTDIAKNYERALIAIEYREATKAAWESLGSLPEKFRIKFLEALEVNPNIDSATEVERIIQDYEKSLNPFISDHMNRSLAEAREHGPEAEDEFIRVTEALGDDVNGDRLLEKIKLKLNRSFDLLPGLYFADEVGKFRVYENRSVTVISEDELVESYSTLEEFLRVYSVKIGLEKLS